MVIAFQIILLIMIVLSAIMAMGEKDKDRQENMVFLCCIAIAIFFGCAMWLW